MYTNAQSLMRHKDEIQHRIMKNVNPAIVALSETRLTDEIEDKEVNIPGYNIVRCNAENRYTGGVAIFIRDDIRHKILLIRKLMANCWFAAIEIKETLYKGILMVIYHSPSASDRDFLSYLEDTIEEMNIKTNCIIIGDFNLDYAIDSFYTKKLQTIMTSVGMDQYVDGPTRITEYSQSMIDLFFANNKIEVQVLYEPRITDHAWLKADLMRKKYTNKYDEFSARKYHEFSLDKFNKVWESRLEGTEQNSNDIAKNFVNNMCIFAK